MKRLAPQPLPPLFIVDVLRPCSAWSIGKKGELAEVACRKRAHGERVAAIALRGALLYSVSYDGALKAWDADNLDIVVDRCVRVLMEQLAAPTQPACCVGVGCPLRSIMDVLPAALQVQCARRRTRALPHRGARRPHLHRRRRQGGAPSRLFAAAACRLAHPEGMCFLGVLVTAHALLASLSGWEPLATTSWPAASPSVGPILADASGAAAAVPPPLCAHPGCGPQRAARFRRQGRRAGRLEGVSGGSTSRRLAVPFWCFACQCLASCPVISLRSPGSPRSLSFHGSCSTSPIRLFCPGHDCFSESH